MIIKKIKIVISIITISIVIFSIASAILRFMHWHQDFMGVALPERAMLNIYNNQFNLNVGVILLKSVGASIDKSKAKNSYNYLTKDINKYKRVNIIIGYLEHSNYFSPKSVLFDSIKNYTKNRWNSKAHNVGEDWGWQFKYPPFVFNSRTIPHPGRLVINGLQIDSSTELRHKFTREYRYVGSFAEIGFCVEDDSWLVKNIPVIFYSYQPQYGSLSFFITPGKEIAYMIFYVNEGTKEEYYKYFKEIEPAIDSMRVLGFWKK